MKNKRIKVFDFDTIENNNFLAIATIMGRRKIEKKRRPDIVGFVNGIRYSLLNLKPITEKSKWLTETNLNDYKKVIPRMFHLT